LGFGATGTITLTVPNTAAGSTRTVAVQITEAYGGPGIDYATVAVTGGTPTGTVTRYKHETQGSPPNDVYVSQTLWQVPANTTSDAITITSTSTTSKDSVIDSIIVDTINLGPDGGIPIGVVTPGGNATVATRTSCLPLNFRPAGTYIWNLADATGAAGTDWDLLDVTGNINITATNNAGDANKFTIAIRKLGTLAYPTNFNPAVHQLWRIATVSGSVQGFSTAKFVVDTTQFGSPAPARTFTVALVDRSLYVVYAPTGSPCVNVTTVTAWSGGAGKAYLRFLNASGMSSVQALTLRNCTLTGHAYGLSGEIETDLGAIGSVNLDARTTLPSGTVKLDLTAQRLNMDTGTNAAVNAIVIDTCGRGQSLDPVITTLEVTAGDRVQQRFEGLLAAERYLQVVNGSPGLAWLTVTMNGHKFQLDALTDGQSVAADLGVAMHEGDQNVAVLTGYGPLRASALVLITDIPGRDMIELPEVAELTLTHAGGQAVLSWPETLTGWQLQASENLTTGWQDARVTPVTVAGRVTVTLGADGAAHFFRLRAVGQASRLAAPGKSDAAAPVLLPSASTSARQPTSTLKRTYDGILW
jgi:hypothetical protein